MNSFIADVIDHFATSAGVSALERRPWYVVTGKAGPHAVLKVLIPPARRSPGYVLTAARHEGTPVVRHEVDVLRRLAAALPSDSRDSIPTVLAHGSCRGREYFATPFYGSNVLGRLRRRLVRSRRIGWVTRWITDLGRRTAGQPLAEAWLDAEYATALTRLIADSRVTEGVKNRVRKNFDIVRREAGRIPSVCCHGDLWTENVVWCRGSDAAVVVDWGAARWPGLPCVDLCWFMISNPSRAGDLADAVATYCEGVDLDRAVVPPLYDLYHLFVKTELDLAYANQPHLRSNLFSNARHAPSEDLAAAWEIQPQP